LCVRLLRFCLLQEVPSKHKANLLGMVEIAVPPSSLLDLFLRQQTHGEAGVRCARHLLYHPPSCGPQACKCCEVVYTSPLRPHLPAAFAPADLTSPAHLPLAPCFASKSCVLHAAVSPQPLAWPADPRHRCAVVHPAVHAVPGVADVTGSSIRGSERPALHPDSTNARIPPHRVGLTPTFRRLLPWTRHEPAG
jgi:hypothetical protein